MKRGRKMALWIAVLLVAVSAVRLPVFAKAEPAWQVESSCTWRQLYVRFGTEQATELEVYARLLVRMRIEGEWVYRTYTLNPYGEETHSIFGYWNAGTGCEILHASIQYRMQGETVETDVLLP